MVRQFSYTNVRNEIFVKILSRLSSDNLKGGGHTHG